MGNKRGVGGGKRRAVAPPRATGQPEKWKTEAAATLSGGMQRAAAGDVEGA